MPKLKAVDDIATYQKIADAAYRRGRSGVSVKDEQDAARYKKTGRDLAIEGMGETGSVIRTPENADDSVANAEAVWKNNLKTERGRAINEANQAYLQKELDAKQAKRLARNASKP